MRTEAEIIDCLALMQDLLDKNVSPEINLNMKAGIETLQWVLNK